MTADNDGRTRVALVFGGRSSEHGVSCLTAREIFNVIDPQRYDVHPIGITTDGRWVAETTDWPVVAGQLPHVRDDRPAVPWDSIRDYDVVFPVLHGPWGEDGTVQGFLEMAGVGYVGAGVLASAVCMDKPFTKTLFSTAGLPQLPHVTMLPAQWENDWARTSARIAALGMPVFVKPARAGSSSGVTCVEKPGDLEAAIEIARKLDPKVIIEAAARGRRELECAVLQQPDGSARASVVGEITVADAGPGEFYDFESKYLDGTGINIVPADIPIGVRDKIRRYAVQAFESLNCEGLARVDFFLTDDGLKINEINTMPGFTPFSMFPLLWEASGIPYADLVDHLLQLAAKRSTDLR